MFDEGNNVESQDSGISQESMQDDYMSSYQLVDNDGNPMSDEPHQEEPQSQEPAQQQPTVEDGKQQSAAEPTNPGQQSTDYMKEFLKEDGTIDLDKATAFMQATKPQPVQQPVSQPVQSVQQPTAQPQPQQPVQPQQPLDPNDQIIRNATAAIQLARQYVEKGYTPEAAMQLAENDVSAYLEKHFMQTKMQEMEKSFNQKMEDFKAQMEHEKEIAKAEPLAEKSLMETCNKFAKGMSAETLRKAIFDQNIGGQFFCDMFALANPDKANLTGEALQKAYNDFFIKNAAANPRFVETLAINAISRIQQMVQPEIAKIIQNNAVQRQTTNNLNRSGPQSVQRSSATAPAEKSKEEIALSEFFHETPRSGRTYV